MTTTLTELANNSGTDKGTQAAAAHGYSLIYDMMLAPLRARTAINILEIGLAVGGPELSGDVDRTVTAMPSVDMWLRYFENGHVTGFDISDFSNLRRDRFEFVRGDAGNRADLDRLRAGGRTFDIILDDASHASFHQQLSMAVLFDALAPGGFYIIEDLSWQPPQMEAMLPAVPKTSRVIADLLCHGKLPATAALSASDVRMLEAGIASVLLFDESYLNALADSYNARHGLTSVRRAGWRGLSGPGRLLQARLWLYSYRRLTEAIRGEEAVNWKSVKLAILHKRP